MLTLMRIPLLILMLMLTLVIMLVLILILILILINYTRTEARAPICNKSNPRTTPNRTAPHLPTTSFQSKKHTENSLLSNEQKFIRLFVRFREQPMILPSQGCAILSGMKDSAFLLQEPTDLLEVIFGVWYIHQGVYRAVSWVGSRWEEGCGGNWAGNMFD